MNIEVCDVCKQEIEGDMYSYKLYKWIDFDGLFTVKHLCFDCYSKIKKYVNSITKK